MLRSFVKDTKRREIGSTPTPDPDAGSLDYQEVTIEAESFSMTGTFPILFSGFRSLRLLSLN